LEIIALIAKNDIGDYGSDNEVIKGLVARYNGDSTTSYGDYHGELINGLPNGNGVVRFDRIIFQRGRYLNGRCFGKGLADGRIRGMHALLMDANFGKDFFQGLTRIVKKHEGCQTLEEYDEEKAVENSPLVFYSDFRGMSSKGPSFLITESRNSISFQVLNNNNFENKICLKWSPKSQEFQVGRVRGKEGQMFMFNQIEH